MKNKKVLIAVGVIIIIICMTITSSIIHNSNNEKQNVIESDFSIPDNYLKKFESHTSHVDGSDIDYYVYSDKIIIDTKSYYPIGQYSYTYEHIIELYDNLTVDETYLNDYHKLIQNKKGKIVLHTYR